MRKNILHLFIYLPFRGTFQSLCSSKFPLDVTSSIWRIFLGVQILQWQILTFAFLKVYLFLFFFYFERYFCWLQNSRLTFFLPTTLEILFYCILACNVPSQISDYIFQLFLFLQRYYFFFFFVSHVSSTATFEAFFLIIGFQ